MSNPTALVQKLWNYCNMGSLAPARSGLRPSNPQKPFRSPPGGSSLQTADEAFARGHQRPPFNRLAPVPPPFSWPALLAKETVS